MYIEPSQNVEIASTKTPKYKVDGLPLATVVKAILTPCSLLCTLLINDVSKARSTLSETTVKSSDWSERSFSSPHATQGALR